MADPDFVAWVEPAAAAGTEPSAYVLTASPIDLAMLHHLEVRIPPGHQGLTGLAMIDSGTFVLPYDAGGPSWIIGDDDLLEYPYERELGANVSFAAYNTGTYHHAWQVRMIYTPMSAVDVTEAVIFVPPFDSRGLAELVA